MKTFKGTQGEWEARFNNYYWEVIYRDELQSLSIAVNNYDYTDGVQQEDIIKAEANAKLIADAGNTINKCGLLPSELLEQRNELLKALQELYEITNEEDVSNYSMGKRIMKQAEQAINKAL